MKNLVGITACLAIAVALPLIFEAKEQYHLVHVLCLVGIYIILALGLNVIIGFTGILNLGYAAFYGIGAYTAALLSIHAHMSFWILLPICGITSAVFGVLLGMPTLRLRGDYIAIVTLGFVEIVRLAFNNLDSITNGPKGLPGIGQSIADPQMTGFKFILRMGDGSFPKVVLQIFPLKFDNDVNYYYLILLLVIGTIFVVTRLHNSRVGRSWVAIREDETAAEAMGVNTTRMKVYAFAAGTFFAGVAGCVYTHWIGFVSPELFTFWESVLLVSMIVLGGMGSVTGVILGTLLIVGIPEVLRDVLQMVAEDLPASVKQSYDTVILARMLIFGVIMVVMVIFRPQGILPALRPRVTPRKPAEPAPGGVD